MLSGNSYRLAFFLRKLYSMPVTVSCFMDAPLFDVIVHDNTIYSMRVHMIFYRVDPLTITLEVVI